MVLSNYLWDLAILLYQAAKEGGYIEPSKVEEIMGISREVAKLAEKNKEEPGLSEIYYEEVSEGLD